MAGGKRKEHFVEEKLSPKLELTFRKLQAYGHQISEVQGSQDDMLRNLDYDFIYINGITFNLTYLDLVFQTQQKYMC